MQLWAQLETVTDHGNTTRSCHNQSVVFHLFGL